MTGILLLYSSPLPVILSDLANLHYLFDTLETSEFDSPGL